VDKLIPPPTPPIIDICRRFPWLCDPDWWRRIGIKPPFPLTPWDRIGGESTSAEVEAPCCGSETPSSAEDAETTAMPSPEEIAYFFGRMVAGKEASPSGGEKGCGGAGDADDQ